MQSRADVASLLSHTAWIRSLALTLARDTHLAEDLVQDSFVSALERPPDASRPLRGWLASVLRNRWSDVRRERSRRDAREQVAARAEALAGVDEVVEKADVQRRLVQAVLELDEPYRTTVLLRFFEGLPQRDIARRMRTKTATVNSRLTRALERLRERLSAEGGDPTAWLRVLLPLLKGHKTAPIAALGVSVVKVTNVVLVCASIAVGIALWSSLQGERTPSTETHAVTGDALDHELDRGPALELASTVESTRELEAAGQLFAETASVAKSPAAAAPIAMLRGHVLDADGQSLAGVALALAPEQTPPVGATSGPNGWFEIESRPSAERIVSADERFATVLAGSAGVRVGTEPTVVVARAIAVAGVVVDENGQPLSGAHVTLRLPSAFGAEWGRVLDFTVPERWSVRTGADGRFDLGRVPSVVDATLSAMLGGFAESAERVPEISTAALRIVLHRPRTTEQLVHGVVLDPAGVPVEGARVSAGGETAVSQRDGAFALDVSHAGTREHMLAVKANYLPARFDAEHSADGRNVWPEFVVLELGQPLLPLRGRVLDEDGRAVSGARVWIDDPTYFGTIGETRVVAETLARGEESFWSFATTDSDGAFSIGGLFDRAYRVQAIDPQTLATVESEPVGAASSPIELVLPTHDLVPRVAGRVVARDGTPLPGIKVKLYRITYELEHEGGTDNDSQDRGPVITGAEGAFEFTSVPKRGCFLVAFGDTILFAGEEVDERADPTHITIVASRRMHAQVKLEPPFDRATGVRMFDANGQRMLLSVMRNSGAHASFEVELANGSTEVLAIDEAADVAVFYKGEDEVARVPLRLVAGELNVVRY